MNIAFFGSSLVSAYWNGSATYCRGMLRALHKRGHRIRFYEPALSEPLAHRDIVDPLWASVVRYTPDGAGVEEALDDAQSADVLIKASGIGLFDDLLEAAVPYCKASQALAVYWDMAAPSTLERLQNHPDDPLRVQLPWYDLVLIRGGGQAVVEGFERLGARLCFPVYNACDPAVQHPVPPDPYYDAASVLLANRAPERDERVQEFFFNVAEELPTRRFLLGGCGWEDLRMPLNVDYLGHVYTGEHNPLYCSARTVLHVSRPCEAAVGYCPAARIFEAASAGACVISDAVDGIETFFEPGTEVVVADSGADVVVQLAALNNERASTIGRRARERALVQHTYAQRALEVEALLEGGERTRYPGAMS